MPYPNQKNWRSDNQINSPYFYPKKKKKNPLDLWFRLKFSHMKQAKLTVEILKKIIIFLHVWDMLINRLQIVVF